MKTKLFFQALFLMTLINVSYPCTSFLITKESSTDGSTMITYSADSHIRYGELYFRKGGVHVSDATVEIRDRSTNRLVGKIPQAPITYNVVGYMNEHQVSIGETTFGGRKELEDSTGLMDYAALMFIVLDRAKTAREAIKIIAELVEQYGYYSSGESFSISDPNEVWIMEIIGKGTDMKTDKRTKKQYNANKGAVWVAIRIPDGYISAHANHARITTFPQHNAKTSIHSKHLDKIFQPAIEIVYKDDVIEFARKQGYFNGKDSEFSFSDVYAPLDFGAARFCEMRVWAFFRQFDDDMDKYIDYVSGNNMTNRMPLYIKPNRKVSLQDLIQGKRDYLQGTEFDMTKDFGAEPNGLPYRWRPLTWKYEGKTYFHERATRTQQTGFSFIAQARTWLPNHIGGIFWFSVDDAGSTVYVPMYCGITKPPETYAEGNGSMVEYSETSAFWTFNKVANFAYLRYNLMIQDIEKVQSELETSFINAVLEIDKKATELFKTNPNEARELLTNFSVDAGNTTVARWKELFRFLLVKYIDGNIKHEENGVFKTNPWGNPLPPKHAGYSEEWNRILIQETEDTFIYKQ